MQVICPNCGARYAVDPLAIGPVGRIVQCARCANRWLQTVAAARADAASRGEVDEPAPAATPETPAAASASDSPPVTAMPSFGAAERPSRDMPPRPSPTFSTTPSLGAARAAEDPVDPAPDLVIRPPRERTSLPVVIEPLPSTRLPLILAGVGTLIVLAGVVAAIYFFREPILAHLPPDLRDLLKF